MSSDDFFQNYFFGKKIFQEHYQSVKWFRSRSVPMFCPDLGPNCLQMLSADDKIATGKENKERVNV